MARQRFPSHNVAPSCELRCHPLRCRVMSNAAGAHTKALWLDQLGPVDRRPALGSDIDVDVAIVGGGFSGLWTAYYLSTLDPALRIAVLEKDFCGFGASGRNGGWCIGDLANSFEKFAKRSSPDASMRLSRAAFDSVDEVGRVAAAEGIDCGFAKGGTIRLARNRPQADRQRHEIDRARAHGFTEDEIRLLSAEEARGYLNATEVRSGIFFAPTAALDPARLVRGLADVVESRGVQVLEQTPVLEIEDGLVRTELGSVTAGVTVRSTEAYTRDLAGERRTLLPVYSLMIATEPLPDSVFDEIGLGDRPTFGDDRHMVIYGQRTSDNRIAFGGRGVPYLFGSRIAESAEQHLPSHELIRETLVDMLPALADATITHRWGGVLGIPRNWLPGLTFDSVSGQATLGGYVGEGVAASNLAGRTMAELITRQETERTSLPWVDTTARKWEPEPLRWLGVRFSRWILAAADRRETKTDNEARLAFRVAQMLRDGR